METNTFCYKIFFVLLVCKLITAQVPGFGKCPDVNVAVADNFNLNAYLGLWYEAAKYPFFFEAGGKCITAIYGTTTDGSVSVVNRQINRFTGNESNVTGVATVVSPGKLSVSFTSSPPPGSNAESNYWILDSDYTTFAVVYSCRDLGGVLNAKIVWILTREQIPSTETLDKAYAVLERNKLSKALLLRTIQNDCGAV